MIQTPVTRLLGIEHPVLQSGMGLIASPRLAAAVSEAGGLGTIGLAAVPPRQISGRMRELSKLTGKPSAVNFLVPLMRGNEIDVFIDEGGKILVLAFGSADPYVKMAKDAGAVVLRQVGSVEHARRCVDEGADIIIAQGVEAGGHQESRLSTLPLLSEMIPAVDPVHVVAAGGIVDGSGLAAALALGAGAVLMGTRFVTSAESAAHDSYKARITRAHGTDTVLTPDLFDVGWPDMPHRVIRNKTVEEWERLGRPKPGERPGEDTQTGTHSIDGSPPRRIPKYSTLPPLENYEGDFEAMALYAGTGCGGITTVERAQDIVRSVSAGAEAIIRDRLSNYLGPA